MQTLFPTDILMVRKHPTEEGCPIFRGALIAIHRLLKPTGSLSLHCDPTMSHYLKIMMDAIFGRKNFKNEIIWSCRTGGVSKICFARKQDVLLYYAADGATFNMQTEKAYTKSKNQN